MAKLLIRDAEPGDRPLLLSTYVHTYGKGHNTRFAPPDLLAAMMDQLLVNGWTTSVACDPDAPDTIIGWVTWRAVPGASQPLVAWLQVRRAWRRHGIGAALLEHAGVGRGELEVGGMVQRVDGPGSPTLVELATKRGITLRYRPFLPWMAATHP